MRHYCNLTTLCPESAWACQLSKKNNNNDPSWMYVAHQKLFAGDRREISLRWTNNAFSHVKRAARAQARSENLTFRCHYLMSFSPVPKKFYAGRAYLTMHN
eukprot:scaffold358112_cov47-Prasinocladus_malaysianus.AAC.2